jgi:DNA-binding transcriptional LysR family regulator
MPSRKQIEDRYMRIDPGQLLTFLAVHEAGGFNRASSTLHKSQPALTRTVHQLEDMIEARVFTRNVSGVELTTEGRLLLAHARVIRHEIKEAETGLKRIKAGKRIQVSIGTAPVHPLSLFSKALADLVAEQPNVDIKLTVQTESALLTSLREGDLSFAILPMPLPQEILELHVEPIFTDQAAIFCRPDHPLAENAAPTIAELGAAGWMMGPPGTTLRDRLDGLFASEGVRQPDVALEVEDQRLRRSLVLECPYLSVFARHNVVDLLRAGQLVEVAYPFVQDNRPVVALSLSENHEMMTTFARLLRQRYEESMGEHPTGGREENAPG